MPPTPNLSGSAVPEPIEFSVEDAMLNTWVEDHGDYLRLDAVELIPREALPPDQA